MAAYQTRAVAPKPRHGATAEDDRIALTPAGAAHLVAQCSAVAAESVAAPLQANIPFGEPLAAQDDDGAFVARLIGEQDAHRRLLLSFGVRPIDDLIWLERDDHIRRLQAKLPPVAIATAG